MKASEQPPTDSTAPDQHPCDHVRSAPGGRALVRRLLGPGPVATAASPTSCYSGSTPGVPAWPVRSRSRRRRQKMTSKTISAVMRATPREARTRPNVVPGGRNDSASRAACVPAGTLTVTNTPLSEPTGTGRPSSVAGLHGHSRREKTTEPPLGEETVIDSAVSLLGAAWVTVTPGDVTTRPGWVGRGVVRSRIQASGSPFRTNAQPSGAPCAGAWGKAYLIRTTRSRPMRSAYVRPVVGSLAKRYFSAFWQVPPSQRMQSRDENFWWPTALYELT